MITLDDKHIEEFGFRAYLEHEHQAVPEIRSKTIEIPGRPGRWNFGSELGVRHFTIPLKNTDDGQVELQQKQNALVAFLFDEFGQPRPFKLIFDYEPDKHYIAEISSSIVPSNAIYIFRTMGLPLVAHDPYRYSNINADEVVWGSESIDFMADYLLGHTNDFAGGTVKVTSNQTLNITASGIAVQPTIEIDGTANNLKIKSSQYEISLPNFSNTKWEIDLERYVVYRNAQETMIDLNKFYLMPGNSEIEVTGNNLNIDIGIKFNDKYI